MAAAAEMTSSARTNREIIGPEPADAVRLRGRPQARAQCGVGEEPLERRCHRGLVVIGHEQRRLVGLDDVGHSPNRRGDNRTSRGTRFDQRDGRAFTTGTERDDVHRAVDLGKPRLPPREMDAGTEVQRRDELLEFDPAFAVADNEQARPRLSGGHAGERAHEKIDVFDSCEPADVAAHDRDVRKARDSPQRVHTGRHRAECVQIETKRHDVDLRSRGDAVRLHQVGALRRRDRDDAIGPARQRPLGRTNEAAHRRTEVAVKDVSMERVDDDGTAARLLRGVVGDGSHASERTGLGRVRVYDVGLDAAQHAENAPEGDEVVAGTKRPAEFRHDDPIDRRSGRHVRRHLLFIVARHTRD